MHNQKQQYNRTTPPPSGVSRSIETLDTALVTFRKRYNLLSPTNSNTDTRPTGLNACDFISSCSTEELEIKSSTPTLHFPLPNLCVLKSRAARRVVKK